ncbi:S1C family serine protease [Streptomyces thermodiastaticus]|uniref:S1C family serine protease n=1 Tax=Streptomyces thermodiastaticus TaxID=44061 RepID=UPI001674295E|nr:trypsin-like peptidase domain-containing protein [Streptomyces thermodiastaticus]MCE7550610.1 trypsin-like peptidase domain-containing protein [Streptomyces thermodiastaticus]GHF70547.1 protease [Streptomyces thermodiastaticus]
MTESIRRSDAYAQPSPSEGQSPSPYQQQHASYDVNAEWPPPPAGPSGRPYGGQAQGGDGTAVLPTAVFPSYGAPGGPSGPGVPPAPPAAAPAPKKRAKGPLALLAAVAIAAAAVGGGTAYALQELTGQNTVASSATSTDVVPTSERGSIAAIAKAVSPSVVEITASLPNGTSTGSGVIISSRGEILTNNHVIANAGSVQVRTSDGHSYDARVVGTDSSKDLALVEAGGASGLKPATLGNSDGVAVGDPVVAIGSPEGLTGTVTAGIVSALDRDVTVSTDNDQGQGDGRWPFEFGGRRFNGDPGSSTTTYKAIQTDASLNPGNSGGALIDANGNVIGINSAMYSASSGSDSASAGSVGLGFAIPINTVKADLAELRSGTQS